MTEDGMSGVTEGELTEKIGFSVGKGRGELKFVVRL